MCQPMNELLYHHLSRNTCSNHIQEPTFQDHFVKHILFSFYQDHCTKHTIFFLSRSLSKPIISMPYIVQVISQIVHTRNMDSDGNEK